jgi:hypothetical protein
MRAIENISEHLLDGPSISWVVNLMKDAKGHTLTLEHLHHSQHHPALYHSNQSAFATFDVPMPGPHRASHCTCHVLEWT